MDQRVRSEAAGWHCLAATGSAADWVLVDVEDQRDPLEVEIPDLWTVLDSFSQGLPNQRPFRLCHRPSGLVLLVKDSFDHTHSTVLQANAGQPRLQIDLLVFVD